jgi:hypothetical protein
MGPALAEPSDDRADDHDELPAAAPTHDGAGAEAARAVPGAPFDAELEFEAAEEPRPPAVDDASPAPFDFEREVSAARAA